MSSWLDAPARRYRGMSGMATDASQLAAKIQGYLLGYSGKGKIHAYPDFADALDDMHKAAIALREQQDPATVKLLQWMQSETDNVQSMSYSDMIDGNEVVDELAQWMALAQAVQDPGVLTITSPLSFGHGIRVAQAPIMNVRAQPGDASAPSSSDGGMLGPMTQSMGIGAAIGAALGGLGLGLATGSAGYGAGGAVVGAVVGAGAAHYYEQGKAKPTP